MVSLSIPEGNQCENKLNAVTPYDWSPSGIINTILNAAVCRTNVYILPHFVRMNRKNPPDQNKDQSATCSHQTPGILPGVDDDESCDGGDGGEVEQGGGKLQLCRVRQSNCWNQTHFIKHYLYQNLDQVWNLETC